MPKKEYDEGRNMEHNEVLHEYLRNLFEFSEIRVEGNNRTKGDIVGESNDGNIKMTLKLGSQKNTQVHLPTLKSFANDSKMPDNVYDKLYKFFGTPDINIFQSWISDANASPKEKKYKRLLAPSIPDWEEVLIWFNNNKNLISKILISRIDNECPAKYLIWINKKKGGIQIIDVEKLINYIDNECTWVTGVRGGGSTLRCINKEDKPIFHCQMKGTGGIGDEYNHNPQFHIHTYWPDSVVIHKNNTQTFNINT